MKKYLLLSFVLIVSFIGTVYADLYTYNDESGVSHITDYPVRGDEKTYKVDALTSENNIELSAVTDAATPPFKVAFMVSEKLLNPIVQYQIDFNGDGIVDYSGSKFDDVYYTYEKEGVFHPKLTVMDNHGRSFYSSTTVTMLSKEQLEKQLKDIWEQMKSAIIAGKMETALSYFMPGIQRDYKKIFTDMGPDKIKTFFSKSKSIHLTNSYGKVANCGIMREEADGTFSYPLIFVKDNNGIWKIYGF